MDTDGGELRFAASPSEADVGGELSLELLARLFFRLVSVPRLDATGCEISFGFAKLFLEPSRAR